MGAILRTKWLLLFLLLLLAEPCSAAIAFDNTGNSGSQTTISYSFTFTASGTNRLLVVGVMIFASNSPTVSSITFAGTNLTFIRADEVAANVRSELWQLVAPSTVANSTLTTTLSVAPDFNSVAGVISLTGVDQVSPVDANNGANGTAGNPSVSVTTVVNNAWLIDTVIDGAFDTPTPAAGQTARWNFNSGTGDAFMGSTKGPVSPAGATTMSWTGVTGFWAQSAASFKPAGGAVAVPSLLPVMGCCDDEQEE